MQPVVVALCGLPGSGKTTFARDLAVRLPAVRFCSDEWMEDLGLDHFDPLRHNLQVRLDALWRELVAAGQSVILEDVTWQREERDAIRAFAESVDAECELHWFDLGLDELWRRLEVRNAGGGYGAAHISRALLEECSHRLQRPDLAEQRLFDRCIVHRGPAPSP